jgi:50S ribosomal protein L16 3-hydroxylase
MTYSIGMRAPQRGALAGELAARLTEDLADTTLYRDPEQHAAGTQPAAIPMRLQRFAAEALRALADRPEAVATALGELLSEPKAHVLFDRPRTAWRTGAVVLDRRTRMLYDARHVYINGDSVRASGADATLLRRLADHRELSAHRVRAASRAARGKLREWFDAGWLHLRRGRGGTLSTRRAIGHHARLSTTLFSRGDS